MARYKIVDRSPRFLPVVLDAQLMSGSFEYALDFHDKCPPKPAVKFQPKDFDYDPIAQTCICPAGQSLYSSGSHCTTQGRTHHKFQGSQRSCGPCGLRQRCLRHPARTLTRQVAFFQKQQASPLPHTERMKQAIDSIEGRKRYGQRMATVEPVFGIRPFTSF